MDKSAQLGRLLCNKITWSVILRSSLLFVLLLYLLSNIIVCEYASTPSPATTRFPEIHATKPSSPAKTTIARNSTESCIGRYIYVHNLPPRFNEDMLKECNKLSIWTDMCKFVSNSGLGPVLENTSGVFSNTSWYGTNQFSVDVIFANRMKKYECLTNDSSMASAIFVPFYAGFDIARHLWGFDISVRDKLAIDLVNLLVKTPEWSVMGGKDHFLVGGRITWDFRRLTEDISDWGNKLLLLPAAKNMSMLVIESSPWHKNDFAIPYPSYFHPANDMDVFSWQKRMREMKRPWLFSFVGARRVNDSKSIRDHIIHQCRRSKVCKLLECDFGPTKCYSPDGIMKVFQESRFCLQPVGDSYTRRSAFDAMLAGCVPVFFHPGSAYTQYKWHLPRNYSKYSVFIPENEIRDKNTSIEKRLLEISRENVVNMIEEVLRLIPRFTYTDPRSKLATHKDAFDVAVEGVIERVGKLRKEMTKGCDDGSCEEDDSSHEWDSFFT